MVNIYTTAPARALALMLTHSQHTARSESDERTRLAHALARRERERESARLCVIDTRPQGTCKTFFTLSVPEYKLSTCACLCVCVRGKIAVWLFSRERRACTIVFVHTLSLPLSVPSVF